MSERKPSLPELLCPAGDFDAMRAAVANGADAVYFGLPAFNARHRATNFTLESLADTMRFLHRHNVKGFVTFNVLIFSDELPQAVEYLRAIAAAGVDAIIVQDLGIARLAQVLVPGLHVHASTQMTLTEPRGIEFARSLGINRVVLAREMSAAEIAKVTAATDMPVEVFVHGALCVAYSGQCLTSESFGGRSANRGQCAQACRLPYELIVDGQPRATGDVQYLVSPTDLGGWDMIDELTRAGVASFKIEGRLKGANYVAQTAQVYRRAIDKAVADYGPLNLPPATIRDLNIVYSRGFSTGFLEGVNHQHLVPGRFPKARGLHVGHVVSTTEFGFMVRLAQGVDADSLHNGDGIVFDLGKPESDEPAGQIYAVKLQRPRRDEPKDQQIVYIELGNNQARPHEVAIGALVWKTSDPQLNKRLEQTYAGDLVVHRHPIDMVLAAHVGGNAKLMLMDGVHVAEAEFEQRLEPAQKFPIDEVAARRQLDRFRDTPFELRTLTLDIAGGPMVPNSILQDLRRRATQELIELRHSSTVRPIANDNALEKLRAPVPGSSETSTTKAASTRIESGDFTSAPARLDAPARLHVLARTMEQVQALLDLPADLRPATIYCDFEDVRRYAAAVEMIRPSRIPVALATIRIIKPGEEGWLKQVLNCNPDQILVRSLAAIGYYREVSKHVPLIGDFSLNVANELTARILLDTPLLRLVPSYDLNWTQMAAMIDRLRGQGQAARGENKPQTSASRQLGDSVSTSPLAPGALPLELVIHQHMPMFHMEHCVFARMLSTGKDFRDCGRPCDRHRVDLKDQYGNPHPLIPDAGCRNTLYNAQAQSALDYLPRMRELGVTDFRLELVRESPEEIEELIRKYREVLDGKLPPRTALTSLRVLKQLGVVAGTLDHE